MQQLKPSLHAGARCLAQLARRTSLIGSSRRLGCRVRSTIKKKTPQTLLQGSARTEWTFTCVHCAFPLSVISRLPPTLPVTCLFCQFDNVGGQTLDDTIMKMNRFGRIILCGQVSQYDVSEVHGVKNLMVAVSQSLTLRGFLSNEFGDTARAAALAELHGRVLNNTTVLRETVVDGFENLPVALIDMLRGANTGKMAVRCDGVGASSRERGRL